MFLQKFLFFYSHFSHRNWSFFNIWINKFCNYRPCVTVILLRIPFTPLAFHLRQSVCFSLLPLSPFAFSLILQKKFWGSLHERFMFAFECLLTIALCSFSEKRFRLSKFQIMSYFFRYFLNDAQMCLQSVNSPGLLVWRIFNYSEAVH